MWNKSCSQHHPVKLSMSAIQPTMRMTTFAQPAPNCGAKGLNHQKANAKRNTLSTLPKF